MKIALQERVLLSLAERAFSTLSMLISIVFRAVMFLALFCLQEKKKVDLSVQTYLNLKMKVLLSRSQMKQNLV